MFRIQLDQSAFQVDNIVGHLVVVVKQLYDDPRALAKVLQGDNSHNVRCVFSSCRLSISGRDL